VITLAKLKKNNKSLFKSYVKDESKVVLDLINCLVHLPFRDVSTGKQKVLIYSYSMDGYMQFKEWKDV